MNYSNIIYITIMRLTNDKNESHPQKNCLDSTSYVSYSINLTNLPVYN